MGTVHCSQQFHCQSYQNYATTSKCRRVKMYIPVSRVQLSNKFFANLHTTMALIFIYLFTADTNLLL
jgi:hypothetical protein